MTRPLQRPLRRPLRAPYGPGAAADSAGSASGNSAGMWWAGTDFWLDIANNYGMNSGAPITPAGVITDTHAQTIYAPATTNIYSPFTANVLTRTDLGLQTVPTRTNVCLWNRDLTNAAWTKSNVTTALNQTGIDGTANSATSLTSTLANGTVLQAITLASSARWQSAFVKRITGSGTINMTMDNGTTWTAVTVTSTTTWTRVEIPTQTLANPTVGFRIVTSGDAIAVDFVQNEDSAGFASAPILTTAAAVTVNGNQQIIDFTGVLGDGLAGFVQVNVLAIDATVPGRILQFGDGAASDNQLVSIRFSSGNTRFQVQNGGAATADLTGQAAATGLQTMAFAAGPNFARFRFVGGTIATDNTVTYPALSNLALGGKGWGLDRNGYQYLIKLALSFGAQNQGTFDAMFARAVLAAAT